jgi:hypothetical protein
LFIRLSGIVALSLFLVCGFVVCSTQLHARAVDAAPSSVDPDKAPSELNHHLAGYALISVGLLVLTGLALPKLRAMQLVWPLLFIVAGMFLAAWSDAEIWPRGNLSWMWLIHHDAEARQHKVYAVLLISLGLLEYLRNRGILKSFWRVWSFPILAILGAGLLLIHDHNGTSGVRNPEVKDYLVNPALDFDGNPWPPKPAPDPPSIVSELSSEPLSGAQSLTTMSSDATSYSSTAPLHPEHPDTIPIADPSAAPQQQHAQMDHSSMRMDDETMSMSESPTSEHGHHMPAAMLVVQREHFWFMIVGFGIAIFKLLSDADFRSSRFVPYFWPSATVLLGVLLTLYRE